MCANGSSKLKCVSHEKISSFIWEHQRAHEPEKWEQEKTPDPFIRME